jgi:hypothetical protein
MNWLKTDDYVDILAGMINNIKYIEIPKNIERYEEIMKIHFDILDIMNQAIIRKNNNTN